jgi:hypothetical protein
MRSPTFAVVALAAIDADGGVRSRMTLPQLGSEMLALLAGWAWFELAGLSGIAASAALAQNATTPSGVSDASVVEQSNELLRAALFKAFSGALGTLQPAAYPVAVSTVQPPPSARQPKFAG